MKSINELLKKAKTICDSYEAMTFGNSKEELFYQYCDDMIRMAFLIAVSDGYVDLKEVDTINAIFGINYDYNIMARLYGLDYISDQSYMKMIPKSIRIVGELEKSQNPARNCFLEDTRALYEGMKEFGNIMLNCTGATLKFTVMIQSYFINNILHYIFYTEELDGFETAQFSGAKKLAMTILSKGRDKVVEAEQKKMSEADGEVKDTEANTGADNADYNSSFRRGSLSVGRSSKYDLVRNKDTSNNEIKEISDKAEFDSKMEDVRNDMAFATGSSLTRSEASAAHQPEGSIDMKQINAILADVDSMIGLGNVKKEIHDMVNMLLINEMRRKKGLKSPVISRHLVFTGNPGTGKTTIARAIGKIYKTLGILEKGHMIETDRSGMVAGYMGQTAEKVSEVVQKAMGGILFIDEAYSLVSEGEGDFGQEAINTLLKLMEDNRDSLVVIVAGYTEEMEDFINSNPGLRSRFNRYIQFNDYSDDELLKIFKNYVAEQDYSLEEGTDEMILKEIEELRAKESENFGNARSVRNYFEKVISNQANRLISGENINSETDELMQIKKEDLDV